jgi:hypothetical protein
VTCWYVSCWFVNCWFEVDSTIFYRRLDKVVLLFLELCILFTEQKSIVSRTKKFQNKEIVSRTKKFHNKTRPL